MNTMNRLLLLVPSVLLLACLFFPCARFAMDGGQSPQRASPSSEVSTTEHIVQQLIAAESTTQRQTIINENQRLLSPRLIESLLEKANLVPIDKIDSEEGADKYESLNYLALGLSQRIGYHEGRAISINDLGAIRRKKRQFDLALAYHRESLSIFRSLGHKAGMAQAYRFLARVHYEQQNYLDAWKCYFEDLQFAEETGKKYDIARAKYNLGVAYEEMEQFNEAIKYYRESLSLSQTITNPPLPASLPDLITNALRRSGRSNFALRQFDQATDAYQRAAEIFHQAGDTRRLAVALNSIGHISLEAENYQKALEAYGESLKVSGEKNPLSAAIANLDQALVYSAQKAHPQALKVLATAKLAAEKLKNNDLLLRAYRAEGIVNYSAGRFPEARTALQNAINIIEQRRARVPTNPEAGPVSLGYQYSPYGWMMALLVSQGQTEEALHYAERSKSRFLFNVLNDPTGKATQLASPVILQEQQRLVSQSLELEMQLAREEYGAQPDGARISSLRSQLQQTRDALVAVRAKIDSELKTIAQNWPQESKLTREDLAALLPNEQTALLQFVMSEEQAFLFVATRSGTDAELQAYPLNIRKQQIKEGVARFRHLITNQDQSQELDQIARDWHDKLLGNARKQLENIRSLIIVPDGPLWEMPFQALKKADKRYLIESHSITYAPSFNVLRKMSAPIAQTAPGRKLLAFGNPALLAGKKLVLPGSLMDNSLAPLPDAERQVNWLRRQYGQQNSKVLTGNLATETSFKTLAPQYGILHLAAHGLYDDLDPMRSSIVLSQTGKAPGEDGFLEAREIIRLKLKAELAILSACETGRGQIRDGEGIIGLPYALFVAGCPTTIVSQWKVSAQSTADLMMALHTRLNQKPNQASKAEALRQAAVSLINGSNPEFRHPFFWAGFIVFGKAN